MMFGLGPICDKRSIHNRKALSRGTTEKKMLETTDVEDTLQSLKLVNR